MLCKCPEYALTDLCRPFRVALTARGGRELRGMRVNSNLRRSWKLYEGLQTEIDTARVEGELTVDPAVYHALLFGLGFFYFLVSIVRPSPLHTRSRVLPAASRMLIPSRGPAHMRPLRSLERF